MPLLFFIFLFTSFPSGRLLTTRPGVCLLASVPAFPVCFSLQAFREGSYRRGPQLRQGGWSVEKGSVLGFALGMGTCATCGRMMTFNPALVPSVRLHGEKVPVCRECIEAANPERERRGLPLIEIRPGAYEACAEEELR